MSWLSSILGLDASHNAGKLSDQAQQQAQQATQQQQQAQAYRDLAAARYNDLAGDGYADRYNGNQIYTSALPNFYHVAGLEAGSGANTGPYGLSPDQQTELNGRLEAINAQKQTALNRFRADSSRRGFTDPAALAAGEAQIEQHFGGLATQHTADFHEAARAARQSALTSLLDYGKSLSGQGAGEQEAATGGIANLGAQTQGAAAQTQGQQNALQQQAAQQSQLGNSAFGGLLQLGGFALGGGFKAPSLPTTSSGSGSSTGSPVNFAPASASPNLNSPLLGW